MTDNNETLLLDKVDVYHYTLHNSHELAEKWHELYSRNETPSVFLSWNWICRWIDTLPKAPIVVEAKFQNQCLGLGIFYATSKFIFPGWFVKQIWLHRTGDIPLDQIWIEHNDFLLDSKFRSEIRQAMIGYVSSELKWHECFIGLTDCDVLHHFDGIASYKRIDIDSPDYSVDLKNFSSAEDYLNSLSKNTKQQIKRSFKLLRQHGQLLMQESQSADEQLIAFTEMANIHIDKWQQTEYGSGFENPHFNQFHQTLLTTDPEHQFSSIFCLSLNEQKLAFIYLLKDDDCWYFYLSAIKPFDDNRIKVGLVAHVMIIEDAIKNNIKKYDFLAGEARYKRSLSNQYGSSQQLVCYYKPSVLLKFRQHIRKLKWQCFNKLKMVSEPEC
ncbi:GNAT family N-acetyltransferase [Paraglaciecola sp.]|uniref:GNAT family N-acetyltransferase n=1 Tax=Paraglaciecola sp. TaxID=1920173 RepID=UPI0030F49E9B